MACLDCGYSYLQEKLRAKVCPRCGANTSQKHIDLRNCTPVNKDNIPDCDRFQPKEDIFDRCRVVSGGGFGVGKGKKK